MDTDAVLGFALGAMFVREAFHGNSRQKVRKILSHPIETNQIFHTHSSQKRPDDFGKVLAKASFCKYLKEQC